MTKRSSILAEQLWFQRPGTVMLESQFLPTLDDTQCLIKSHCSAVSAGTELLVYRGQLPTDMAVDARLPDLQDKISYPLQYGYASVGEVIAVGTRVPKAWVGRRVFAFAPHGSHFVARLTELIFVPDDISSEAAVFLANMETAVSLIQEAKPLLGEHLVVLGQGALGLLVAAILKNYPLASLWVGDTIEARRSRLLPLEQCFDPKLPADIARVKAALTTCASTGADAIIEVTGAPQALNLALALSGYDSRIIVGSWYGTKSAPIALGGEAHRNHVQISTSQVSRIPPSMTGRWDKARRFDTAWSMIRKTQPQHFISHRLALRQAPEFYWALDQQTEDIQQALFVY